MSTQPRILPCIQRYDNDQKMPSDDMKWNPKESSDRAATEKPGPNPHQTCGFHERRRKYKAPSSATTRSRILSRARTRGCASGGPGQSHERPLWWTPRTTSGQAQASQGEVRHTTLRRGRERIFLRILRRNRRRRG